MKRSFLFVLFIALIACQSVFAQIPQTMSYQGVLTNTSGDPVADGSYNLTFRLYDDSPTGNVLWSETQTANIANGLFSIILGKVNPLNLPFDQTYWMGITVGSGTEMAPLIELSASPYALNTQTVADSSVKADKIADNQVVRSVNGLRDNLTLAAGNNVTISESDHTITISATGGGTGTGWSLTGNAGTTAGTNFLGTTDDHALEFKVNNARVFRIEPDAEAPNIIGGYSANYVSSGVKGATISGGGSADGNMRNRVSGNYGTIGGGLLNVADSAATVGGGKSNYAYGYMSTIGGGYYNRTENNYTTVCGGIQNKANGAMGAVCGGSGNTAGYRGFVGGGEHNEATGNHATVPGGNSNKARASYSFAAGYKARANHTGSFVWSDFAGMDSTSSTGENQFIIRAAGGMGINTNTPVVGGLTVASTIESTTGGFKFPDGTVQTTAATGSGTGTGWGLTGNAGTTPGTNFLGTTDNQALELKVNSARAFRIEPTEGTSNIIGGCDGNGVESGLDGAIICGGGKILHENRIIGDGYYGTIGGGEGNTVSGIEGIVSGGHWNIASGRAATVSGGSENAARGEYSFAAGLFAKANHDGSFVWSDFSSEDSTYSTGANQFIIRAAGGVGIGTNDPQGAALHLGSGELRISSTSAYINLPNVEFSTPRDMVNYGDYMRATGKQGFRGFTMRETDKFAIWRRSDWNDPTSDVSNLVIDSNGHVGIGTENPEYKLQVVNSNPDHDEPAIYGKADETNDQGIGIKGEGGHEGVLGTVTTTGNKSYQAVRGVVFGADGENIGVIGIGIGNGGTNYGVYGQAVGDDGVYYGVYGDNFGNATGYAVYASGDLAYTGDLINVSDAKFKRNIQDYSGALAKLMRLRPREFEFDRSAANETLNLSKGKHFGLVAQELEQVFPELVVDAVNPPKRTEKGEPCGEPIHYKGVKTIELIPVLIKAIQEQQKTIEELKVEIANLKNNQ